MNPKRRARRDLEDKEEDDARHAGDQLHKDSGAIGRIGAGKIQAANFAAIAKRQEPFKNMPDPASRATTCGAGAPRGDHAPSVAIWRRDDRVVPAFVVPAVVGPAFIHKLPTI